MQTVNMRVFYAKTQRAKYISHLDTMRTITRALRRTKLPFWYTEGFNPHLYLTFALPLSLGYEGLCESFDIKAEEFLKPETVKEELSKTLPPGFEVISVAHPKMKATEIACANYGIDIVFSGTADCAKLESFFALDKIEVVKKTKKGEVLTDIKPLTEVLSHNINENALSLTLRAASGTSVNINPALYINALTEYLGLKAESIGVVRTKILNKNYEEFC